MSIHHINTIHAGVTPTSGPRSPFALCDDSDDDGASDYADHPRQRLVVGDGLNNNNHNHKQNNTVSAAADSSPGSDSDYYSHHNDEYDHHHPHNSQQGMFLQRLYDTAVDAPCQVPCQRGVGSIEDQLDLLTVRIQVS